MTKISDIFGTAIVVVALLSLLALGTWQLQRMTWKTDMLTAIEVGMASEPVVLGNVSLVFGEYTRIKVTGRFDHSKEMYLHAINKNGSPGFYIYVPFHIFDNKTIIVNRGFVSPEFLEPSTRMEALPDGIISLTGVLRKSAVKKYFIPENNITTNRWFFADLDAMTLNAGLVKDNVYPMILELEANPDAAVPPYGGVTRVNLPNNHLGYAVTWYGLALALLVVVFIYRRKQPKTKKI